MEKGIEKQLNIKKEKARNFLAKVTINLFIIFTFE